MNEKENINDAYKKFAEGLEEVEEEDKEKRKEVLKQGVLDLEQKYRDEIKGTHVVDERIVKLRQEADMADLIGTGERVQKSNFKDKKKFEQFLAKEILEVGIDESRSLGGVMTFKEFCKIFPLKRSNWEAPPNELKKSLEYLASSGLIPKLYNLKNKDILITFKPVELQADVLTILNIASSTGSTSVTEIVTLLGWKRERIELTLKNLADQEITYFDKKEKVYFFPCLRK
ncbi:MAG TPA: hypothetical protein VMX55_07520 [candidate division Zixibacteria bacterium]|nr:hypothetical protein [candidate division Zixibacteria bacterium]